MKNYYGNFEESSYYHVMIRGIAKQIIFEEISDNKYFLKILESFSKKYNISIICYCLMINHVHIECQDFDDNLSAFMCNLCSTYARYFNKKYDRCGALFQRPYNKKLIKNEGYLLQVYHYIIKNPENEGICPYEKYTWSSYKYYFSENHFTNSNIIKEILGSQSLDSYLQTQIEANNEIQYKSFKNDKITDNQALELVKTQYNLKTTTNVKSFDKEKRKEIILFLKTHGLSVRQIERVTGISRGIIQNIV